MSPSAPLIDRLALAFGSGLLAACRCLDWVAQLGTTAARAVETNAGPAVSKCVDFTTQNTCVLVGHDWHWPYEGDQPICARCDLTVDQAEATVAT